MFRPLPQTAAAVGLGVLLAVAAAWMAERERAANQAAYDRFVRSGVAPAPPPAVSGATLSVQERL